MSKVSQNCQECQHPDWQRIAVLVDLLLMEETERLAHETGFVQRRSPISGPAFANALIWGFLSDPDASYSTLQQMLGLQGIQVSAQAIAKRMSEQAAHFLQRLCEWLVGRMVETEAVRIAVLARFNGVYLQDGTVIGLPDVLQREWPGCGGRTEQGGRAGLQVQLRLDLCTGHLQGPWVQAAHQSEKRGEATAQATPLPKGSLYVTDAGMQSLSQLRWVQEQGIFYLSAATLRPKLIDTAGRVWELPGLLADRGSECLDEPVLLGLQEQVPVRLIALKEPKSARKKPAGHAMRCKGSHQDVQVGRRAARKRKVKRLKPVVRRRRLVRDWIIVLTNVPVERLSATEARELMRARWQIELIWKLWKQHGHLDEWRSEKPMRILCEVFAKLIGLIVVHWLTIVGCWSDPHRSLVKAARLVRTMAPAFLLAMLGLLTEEAVLGRMGEAMRRCQLNPRRKHPNTSQRLLRLSG